MTLERLQKTLAQAGVGSRRKCEEFIADGRVTVDGVVIALGAKADPETQDIRLDGQRVRAERAVYYALHKPRGIVSTTDDPEGRTTVLDLVPTVHQRLFCVGRLDASSEGLMILTNDGAFANRVLHPRYEVPKTYELDVAGLLTNESQAKLLSGVYVEARPARALKVEVRRARSAGTALTITIAEGRKRILRRMFRVLGHPVSRLKRVRIGTVELGELAPGAHRRLTKQEVDSLLALSGKGRSTPSRASASPPRRPAKRP